MMEIKPTEINWKKVSEESDKGLSHSDYNMDMRSTL